MSDYGNEDLIVELRTEIESLQARLAETEALLHEATMLLFDWDALVGGTGSHATETRELLERVGYDPMTATLRKADSASACAHEWVNASNFEPGPNERCWKCNAIRRIADQPEPVTCKHGEVGSCFLCDEEDREHDEEMARTVKSEDVVR